MPPNYKIERGLGAPEKIIAGVDEVGYGALAGDVVAAAVILDAAHIPEGIDDSKKLSPRKRERLFALISAAAEIGIGRASAREIDRRGLAAATLSAMRRALEALPRAPDAAIIDGLRVPDALPYPARAIVRGDQRALSIAAASIAAKITRDAIMRRHAKRYRLYGWERNVGYGTAEHRAALARHGATPHHRRSFRGV